MADLQSKAKLLASQARIECAYEVRILLTKVDAVGAQADQLEASHGDLA
eukprot:CAMPEP_0113716352 /NCGR_PEP_ID=MMETSP0038_2-20120614/33847_1 /TAXON_ID=2898 /ORGANISM="Cryptomonas paramecium" /LENGTH=48 /DNA_ID=CAMNT_0000643875 /DNA_START=27 /DNA_END=169 /DNA_ORIENTATION=+ /assembly_acc=CAM_ASM_000170